MGDKNGQLERQTYGNGDYTSFQYDNLNRTTGTTTSSGDSYHYSYAGDGQLHKMGVQQARGRHLPLQL